VIHAQLPDGVLQEMPEQIRAVLAEAREVEFATISARGVPVNNPPGATRESACCSHRA
jgi:hypothetical protein